MALLGCNRCEHKLEDWAKLEGLTIQTSNLTVWLIAVLIADSTQTVKFGNAANTNFFHLEVSKFTANYLCAHHQQSQNLNCKLQLQLHLIFFRREITIVVE